MSDDRSEDDESYTGLGDRTEHHPSRRVDPQSVMNRMIQNYDPSEEGEPEPDYEAITEARQERHRPDWDDPRRY